MSETSLPDGTLTEHAHQLVDGLTALKVHVGLLRLQVQQGAIEAGELDAVLGQVEGRLDAAGVLAQRLRDRTARLPPKWRR
jgi:hypothetical protein